MVLFQWDSVPLNSGSVIIWSFYLGVSCILFARTLLSVLQEIRSSSAMIQESTDLVDLAVELNRTRFDFIIPFSAFTSFGLEDLRDKIKALL